MPASDTGPFATRPTAENRWIHIGRLRIMVAVSDLTMLEGLYTDDRVFIFAFGKDEAMKDAYPVKLLEANIRNRLALLILLMVGSVPASAQEPFDLRFDHSTVPVSNLETSALFYEHILHLEPLETPWGPTAPVRFFSLGGSRQLHVGLSDGRAAPDKNIHLAFAVGDFDAYLHFLRDQGVPYVNFPGNSSSPQVRPDGVRQIYLQDPDGNWIEINDAAHSPLRPR